MMASEKPYSGIKKLSGSDFFGALLPLDIATIFYLLFSAIYICFGSARLENMTSHFVVRIAVLCLIFFLTIFYLKFPNKITSFLRHLYPLIFLGFFYTETSYMKNIIFERTFTCRAFSEENIS